MEVILRRIPAKNKAIQVYNKKPNLSFRVYGEIMAYYFARGSASVV